MHTAQIRDDASQILKLIASHPRSQSLPRRKGFNLSLQPRFSLQPAQSILNDLLKAGIRPDAALRLSNLYGEKAEVLKRELENTLERCEKSLMTDEDVEFVRSRYRIHYKETLGTWLVEFMESSTRHGLRSSPNEIAGGRQSGFNTEAIPTLEESYAYDPYPTRETKVALAKETGMKYRQIHVWFQNRRTRSKREGRKPRRTTRFASTSSEGSASSFECENDLQESCGSEAQSYKHTSYSPDVFKGDIGGPRPQHVFPSTYPPTCDVEPFPVKLGQVEFKTPWFRHTASSPATYSRSVDIDDLSQSFSFMSLDGCEQDSAEERECGDLVSRMITFSVTTPRAPLPSFIARKDMTRSFRIDRHYIPPSSLVSKTRNSSVSTNKPVTVGVHSLASDINKLVADEPVNTRSYHQARTHHPKSQQINSSLFSSFRIPTSAGFYRLSDKFTSITTQLPGWRVAVP